MPSQTSRGPTALAKDDIVPEGRRCISKLGTDLSAFDLQFLQLRVEQYPATVNSTATQQGFLPSSLCIYSVYTPVIMANYLASIFGTEQDKVRALPNPRKSRN